MIRFENVGMRYGTGPEVLRDLTFELGESDFRFLIGASGAGKSTLMKLMYLAHRPTRGLISILGQDIARLRQKDVSDIRRRIGVVFQDFRLLDHLTTFENVALPLRVRGAKDALIRKHVTELLAWVGLADQINAYPQTLSGGQKQRAAIARAVITRPSLLLADEPTGNVDDAIAVRLLYLFEELNRMGTTVVIATHNRSLVERFRKPLLILRDGQIHTGAATTPVDWEAGGGDSPSGIDDHSPGAEMAGERGSDRREETFDHGAPASVATSRSDRF